MATVSPESNTIPNSLIDQYFDLDLALTMEDNSGHGIKVSGSLSSPIQRESPLEADQMATVTSPAGVCTVCMESFQSGTIGNQVPCGHVYHPACIAMWLSLHDSCPLCRWKISGDRQSSPAVSS